MISQRPNLIDENFLDESLLNVQQLEFVSFLKNKLLSTQRLCILRGNAGVGKSYVLQHINFFYGSRVLFVASSGKAASELPFTCFTIHTGLEISPYSGDIISNLGLQRLKERLMGKDLICLEEYSMCGRDTFLRVEENLRMVGNKNIPFGGFSILLIGDIFQLPPVGQSSIFKRPQEKIPSDYNNNNHNINNNNNNNNNNNINNNNNNKNKKHCI